VSRSTRGAVRPDLVLAGGSAVLALLLVMLPDPARVAVAATLRDTVFAPLLALEARAARTAAGLRGRDAVLASRGAQVSAEVALAEVGAENRTLRALLGLAGRLRQGFVVADLVPGRSFEADFTVGLTAGSEAGIAPFQPVVTARGLVGMVERADPARSEVITWAHPDFAASAMSADGTAFGIVKPHLAAGARRWLLEMRGVRYRSRLDTGVVVVTSGLGSTFPRGIVIGTIIGELATPEQWSRTYLVAPAVLPDGVGPVVVLTPGGDSARIAAAWRRATVDSATRGVLVAADSLAADSLAADAAAAAARRVPTADSVADSVAADQGAANATVVPGRLPRPASPPGRVGPPSRLPPPQAPGRVP
jgi:rod shape-determining protein MreC